MSAEPKLAKVEEDMPHREWREPLIRYLVSLGLSRDDGQDVAQEAFLRMHQHIASAGDQRNLRSWLFRVAHNEARNRQQTYERRYGSSMDGVDAADSSNPESRFLKKERQVRLVAAMKTLSETERECLLLRAEGLRYREIGDVLSLPVSTVADMVERCIKKLAEKIL